MKLIVISNPVNLNNEHQTLHSLFEAGLNYYHLRKPDLSQAEVEIFLEQISSEYHKKIVLHSHFALAEQYDLKGIHVKMPFRKTRSEKCSVSTSFHSIDEIEDCREEYDYAFLSPVFDSISKKGYRSAFDKNELNGFLNSGTRNAEIIALGGIDEHTIEEAMNLGFNGVAVLGAVWLSKEPIGKFKRLLNVFNSFNKIKETHHA
jgi:thiamine-phosphate pyrophosphorylase